MKIAQQKIYKQGLKLKEYAKITGKEGTKNVKTTIM